MRPYPSFGVNPLIPLAGRAVFIPTCRHFDNIALRVSIKRSMRGLKLALFVLSLLLMLGVFFGSHLTAATYLIDCLREVFVRGRVWLLLLALGSGPIYAVLWWATVAAVAGPIQAIDSDDDARAWVPIALVPPGLGLAYLLWRVSNWLVYGLIDVEPWAFKFVFGWLGLGR